MKSGKTGVWIIGALGSVATTVITGALAMGKQLASTTGMITAYPQFDPLGLVEPGDLVFGGCDVRRGSLMDEAQMICRQTPGLQGLVEDIATELAMVQEQLTPGTGTNCGAAIEGMINTGNGRAKTAREEIDAVRRTIAGFRNRNDLERVVVINLASTEPPLAPASCHDDLETFEVALDRDDPQVARASTVYAYAAVQEDCPYINFTPSNGALLPAIIQLADQQKIPVMGNDGKTGETLVKSALAPMFTARNLEVLSWEGFNILGNRDGEILDHPENREAKIHSKDQVLARVLGYAPHSKVGIDYVPSLGDRKTAWDFIHFRGFLGVDMSLQFVWQGYDSILAAPLVLDLVRLAELAARNGEGGLMPHLGLFFKSPLGVTEHRLAQQFEILLAYAKRIREDGVRLKVMNKKGV
ncbi:MAG: myo-inositol-1-phosphate synthase [Deltaproteobacteria bacterium]|nr:MAG: myo-inositol-1-phosphate synthase [Deltaproteobacteria bacterium]